ncbi:MAG: MarR family winged helix-turn-helix transcriptional regulator [Pseudonocardiaceae bacterium]
MGIHRNVMVGLVDELEDRGLIERRRHPADRRAHAIHLTAAAHDLLRRAQRVADEHEAETARGNRRGRPHLPHRAPTTPR